MSGSSVAVAYRNAFFSAVGLMSVVVSASTMASGQLEEVTIIGSRDAAREICLLYTSDAADE